MQLLEGCGNRRAEEKAGREMTKQNKALMAEFQENAKAKPGFTPERRAKRYGKAWKTALCGPHGNSAEEDLAAHNVAYRLEKAWLDGFKSARAVIAAVKGEK